MKRSAVITQLSIVRMLKQVMKMLSGTSKRWEEVERFDQSWRDRIKSMAAFIEKDDRMVVDVGCGPMWLRDYLPQGVGYLGVDYVYRGENMTVCDLNRKVFPAVDAPVYFVSGTLEYLDDPMWFINTVSGLATKCILSYCGLDYFPDHDERIKRGWKNHYYNDQIIKAFGQHGMRLVHEELTPSKNAIFLFIASAEISDG